MRTETVLAAGVDVALGPPPAGPVIGAPSPGPFCCAGAPAFCLGGDAAGASSSEPEHGKL